MKLQGALGVLRSGLESVVKEAVGAVEDAALHVSNMKSVSNYKLLSPVATCGPGDLWALYAGISKKPGAVHKDVTIWVLDKRRLYESNRNAKPRAFDAVLDQQRKSCQHMTRLKHPGVVKVIEPLEENAGQMVLVTEPIAGSLRNIQTRYESVPGASSDAKQTLLSPLEVKLGLVHITETLSFLGEAGLAHCGLTPSVILVTLEGAWKLAGFTYAIATDYASGGEAPQYIYNDPFPPMWDELAKPQLAYTAPELVGGWGGPQALVGNAGRVTPAADVFSLAAIAYELLSNPAGVGAVPSSSSTTNGSGSTKSGTANTGGTTGAVQQLLPVRSSLAEYRTKVMAGQGGGDLMGGGSGAFAAELAALPLHVQGVLRSMLSPSPGARPLIAAFYSSPFFQDDVLLRALRFLDTILQRETGQKIAFLKDLSHLHTQFDDRLIRLKVLPPLIQELRQPALQPAALPVVLALLERVQPPHFSAQLLPALQPILENAGGDLLAGLVAGSPALSKLMSQDAITSSLVPLYVRALEGQAGPGVTEECCRVLQGCVQSLDYTLLKAEIMPRVYAACMRTTAAAVRIQALQLMARAVPRMDRDESDRMVEAAAQVVSVDRSAPTIAHTAALLDAVSKQWGPEVSAGRLLPILCPLLIAPSLGPRQVAELLAVVQGMLTRLQAKLAPDARALAAAGVNGNGVAAGNTGGSNASGTGVSSNTSQAPVTWDTPLPLLSRGKSNPAAGMAGQKQGFAGQGGQQQQEQQQQQSMASSNGAAPGQLGSWAGGGGSHTSLNSGASVSWTPLGSASAGGGGVPGSGTAAALGSGWQASLSHQQPSTQQQQQQQQTSSLSAGSGWSLGAAPAPMSVGTGGGSGVGGGGDMFGGLSLADTTDAGVNSGSSGVGLGMRSGTAARPLTNGTTLPMHSASVPVGMQGTAGRTGGAGAGGGASQLDAALFAMTTSQQQPPGSVSGLQNSSSLGGFVPAPAPAGVLAAGHPRPMGTTLAGGIGAGTGLGTGLGMGLGTAGSGGLGGDAFAGLTNIAMSLPKPPPSANPPRTGSSSTAQYQPQQQQQQYKAAVPTLAPPPAPAHGLRQGGGGQQQQQQAVGSKAGGGGDLLDLLM